MRKPGVGNIIIGVVTLMIGVTVTIITYSSAEPGGTYILAWGPTIFGAFKIIQGLIQFISFSRKNPQERAFHYAKIEVRAITISMIHQALSDGNLHENEATTIKTLLKQYTGVEIDNHTFNDLIEEAKSNQSDYLEELKELRHSLRDQAKGTIIRMSYLVLLSDEIIEDDERTAIFQIAKALGMKESQALQIINDTGRSLEQA